MNSIACPLFLLLVCEENTLLCRHRVNGGRLCSFFYLFVGFLQPPPRVSVSPGRFHFRTFFFNGVAHLLRHREAHYPDPASIVVSSFFWGSSLSMIRFNSALFFFFLKLRSRMASTSSVTSSSRSASRINLSRLVAKRFCVETANLFSWSIYPPIDFIAELIEVDILLIHFVDVSGSTQCCNRA